MRKLTLFITSLFLGIVMAWAQTVPSGSLVTFTNVQKDGTEYVLHIDDSGVLAVGEAGKAASEYGDAAKFKAELQADGKYSFYNEAKNLYLIIRGLSYGHNGDKGVLAEYNSYYCDITIVDGSSVKENTFCLSGQRDASHNRKGELIIMKSRTFDSWDGAPAWDDRYSNLFRIDVVEEDVTVELTDTESGITFGGTYRGLRNSTEPILGWGCQLSNQVWNGNTLTADIQLPFAINEETMIAIHEPELLHRLYVDGENIRVDKTPFEYSNINDWIWKIHPVMTGNVVTFTIEHVATGKYAKAGDTNQHYVEGTVTLVEKESCNTFEIANYGSYPSFKVCGKNSYLSINTDRDESVALGLYGNAHNGTRIHFAPVPVATIGGVEYTTFADAVAAAQSGDVITLLAGCDETVSINKSNVAFTIDGAQQTYAGKIQINIGQNVTIKNVNFVHSGDAAHDFIANVGSPTGKNYNTTLLVENCSFTGNGKENVVAVRTIHPTSVTIEDCTATGLHSFLQNTGGQVVTIDGVTLTDSKGGLAIGSPNGAVSVKNCNLATATYGVRLDANNANAPGATLENNKVTAYIPVSVRKAEAPAYNLTFNGDASEYTATNGDNVWCAVCKDEYEEGVALNNPTGKINVTLNDANLDATGVYGEYVPAAKIGDTEYDTLEEAFKAATAGCTIDILSDVTVDYAWDARYTGGKFTVPVTINGNSKTIRFTASVEDKNYQAPFRFEADATVNNLTIDMSEATDSRFRAISSKGNLTVDGCKFIGKDETLNCRAIIFGEGAGANVGNLAISITNCEFINWRRGITDNENGQDVKTVTVTGNTLRDAAVYVSAKETVTFTGNIVEGAYVNIKSYTADNKLQVTATGNTLEENTDTAYNVINAGGKVEAEGFNIVAKGRDFNGYTGENRIWGETWGNARESFVIKVLDANGNVMGTTSLNNVDGFIDGDVLATWSLLFDAASNTDEYWTMEWTTAPSISNMPAKVALWVDGVEVSGGDVVLNAPDDLNKIVAAATDAEGKILSCHTSLADAVATNATNIALLRETDEVVELPFGVTLDKNGFTAENVTETLPVAKIGDDAYFATLQAALDAATDGQTVTLLTGITLTDADMVKIEGKYNVMMNVSGKDITLDLNEQTINIDYNGGQYLYAAVFVADGAGLTVTGNGKIDIAENGINVAYMFWKRGTTGHLTIESGTYHMDDSADSMVYTNGSKIVTVNGGTFTLDAVGTRDNGFPCIFNANGSNERNIIVNGGTFNTDVNHQYWAHEVNVPETLALKDNGDGTWTVVPAVAYTEEKVSSYIREVGYATLDEALAAAEEGERVVLLSDIEIVGTYTIAAGKELVLDLNGKTIAATDNTSKNYGAIDNRGDLTITDSSEEQTGKITVTATVNSGWNRYSAVIANNPGGKLTVNGGTLEHLGGTDMAYGIDNLTNGKGTYAETIINGGVVKSPYRGIRQFLNGVEAQNILTVNGGTIEGANKSIWMQDPSKNANTGTLTVGENASLIGDVYLFVTAGSTEWPVEVSIAAAALQGESQVVTGNIPANWTVSNVNGTWGKVAAVATTNGVGYTSVTEAINAAEDGGVVEIFAGTISEYIAPWAGNSKHDTEKSITIQGAADFGTVLTGGMYLGYDDSQCREHNITVKGIHFTGKGLTVACQQNVTIEDNKFTDIEGRAIAVIGKNINSEVKNNVIENTTSVGIELRNTLTATVEGNTITGTGHNALQITSQVGSTESVATVRNNTMSDWGVGGEGRAMRFEGIVTATVNGNVMSHTAAPEEFAKITNTTTLDASQNYWNGVSPLAAGMFTGVEGDPAVVLKSYYTDAEKTNLVEFSAAGSAARIGSVYFATLADAVAAAQANDVITFLTDINESLTISKSVTIDGGNNTLAGKITTDGSSATLRITIRNINFDGGNEIDYAVRADNNSKLVIENCSVDNYTYGFLYANKTNDQILVKDVAVKNANYGAHLVSFNNATFENVTIEDGTYGVMVQNQGSRNVVLNNCTMTDVETPLHVWEKGTANVTFAFEGTNKMGVEQLSSSQYAIYKNAAMVGTTVYGDLNEAIAAAAADGTVTLLGDMAIESDLNNDSKGLFNIAADAQVTIDLNGKTIDVTDKSAGNFIVFYNYGDLTIKNGTVNLVAENNRAWNAQSTIILNRGGNLTVESGTYTHNGGTDMAFALDNSGNSFGDAHATIVDGTLESTYTAIRNRMADPTLNGNPGNGTAELTIQGGLIKGVKRGIWGQITNASSDFLGSLTVTGGTIEATDAIRMDADSHENITVKISDEAVIIKGNLVGDYADYNVTGGTFYNEVEEGYLAWGYQLVGDAAPYTVEYTGKVSEFTLVDGEFTEFVNEQEVTVGTLTYERTLPAAGNWYPLYVPFEVPVEALTALGYEAAFFYDVHFEVLAGGEIDPTSAPDVHLIKIKEGTLKANFPYVIRANASADLNLSLVLENTTLFTTAASAMNSVESGSTINRFIFAGTYKKAKPEELTGDANVPCYAITNSGTLKKMSATASLSPFRVYMSIIAKDGSPIILNDVAAESIRMRVIGEENEDGTTFIYDVEMDGEHTSDYIYDLQGRRVLEPQKGGLYIVNGKKVVF